MQRFKANDETEKKVIDTALPTLEALGDERDNFYNGAFETYPLGDVLYSLGRDPMVGVILEEIYRTSYPAIHELFTKPSNFEFYLNLFRSIWGEDVEIQFQIPSPGVLYINIDALTVQLQEFNARRIEDDVYIFETVVTQDGDTILFQGVQGIKTQREADALINELSANGVYTEINLTISP